MTSFKYIKCSAPQTGWTFLSFRAFNTGSACLQVLLDHPLIWSVDWFKVKAGFYCIVDPTNPRELIYLGEKDFRDFIKVMLSNREPMVVLARAGENQPKDSEILTPKPKSPHSTVFFRSFRVYSKFLRALWSEMWEGKLVVPLERNLKFIICNWGKTLLHWLGTSSSSRAQSQGLIQVSKYLMVVLKHRGATGLTIFLKVSFIALNKYLAGEPLKSTFPLKCGMRLQGGLPSWLPAPVRLAIRQKSYKVIRLWSSLLYTYKGMYAKGVPSIASVLEPEWYTSSTRATWLWGFQDFLANVYYRQLNWVGLDIPQSDQLPLLRTSAGPSGGTALAGVLRDLWVWRVFRHNRLHYSLEQILAYTGNGTALGFLRHGLAGAKPSQVFPLKVHKKGSCQEGYDIALYDGRKPLALARLHLIYEAAGKVRVIAILDYMTQWAFAPVHDFLMRLLATVDTDGTSDQNIGLQNFILRIGSRKGIYSSLDISAATDTIPWQLYEVILGVMFDARFARHYMRLLRERGFLSPRELPFEFVKYGCGQPMGALSSFPLLGLVHHAIVQYAAYEANSFPFYDYCIVGDDLVLFEEDKAVPVATKYLSMCRYLGIRINKSKTYQSEVFFNFISRSFLNGIEVSPASMKSELSVHTLGQRVENTLRNCSRWSTGDSRSVMTRIIRFASDHWVWGTLSVSLSQGFLTSYVATVLASLLSPAGRFSSIFGVKEEGWIYWVAALRGSSIILSHDASALTTHYLKNNYSKVLILIRTTCLVLRSELESLLVSGTKIADLYPSWMVKQPRGIRLLYQLFREQRVNYAYFNFSSREVRPLLGYPIAESSSLLDEPDYEIITGMSHEELIESYIMELLIYSMGYLVPRKFVPYLQEFYEAWSFIFSDNPDPEQLGQYLTQILEAVLAFKPDLDYRDVDVLSKVTRSEFGHTPRSSVINSNKFVYAKSGFANELLQRLTIAWRMILSMENLGINPEETLKLPLPTSSFKE
ncbi:RNA-dependent RNA polymerase [Gigaspora margarita mitovirus 2]|uniref:RNA-dependent RNA polymerase n=1 Tax=Gigaspora margarita mitovirus 2 TaxID=2082666 RepID=A0A2L0VZH6_9VIRU|nr:RNA-dependent RNA polymerase [Gigaspora margarita mitovirus 2]AVA17450.1 RNA-dependent RNA polymerase [Gigaspora margarita mitovirus 2]